MWTHALLDSAGAQASSYRHIRPEHLNNSLPYVSKLEAMPHRCAACSPYQVNGGGVHTWPEWHRGRPGIAVWVH